MSDPVHVTVFEMSPRDGLQNEKNIVETAKKIELVNLLSRCGFSRIEVTSFVSAKWVPQMADAADVMAGIDRNSDVSYACLTPNIRGYEGARSAQADEVAIFASASEGFSQKNINCSIEESVERFRPVMETAARDGVPVRGYVSCITDCPFDGSVEPAQTARVAGLLYEMGCYEISLGDTIGRAEPESTQKMLDAVLECVPCEKLAGHFHDTQGHALENIDVSLEKGVRVFDSSVGGLGGCPYAPGAKGNVDTRSVVDLMNQRGFETGIDIFQLDVAAEFAISLRGASN